MPTVRLRFRVMRLRKIKILFILLGPLALVSFAALSFSSAPVTLESRESQTFDHKPVFNRIQKFTTKNQDIWMMQQSHHGPDANTESWDLLKIVVDKSTHPYQAKFYQLEPGPLSLSHRDHEIKPKVTCVLCHNNGPRAIRPELNSEAKVSLIDQLKIVFWNFSIKTYPRILAVDTTLISAHTHFGDTGNDTLKLKSCTLCHRDPGEDRRWMSRGFLTRKNALAIRFMTENKQMPPFPFAFPEAEQKALHAFLVGL